MAADCVEAAERDGRKSLQAVAVLQEENYRLRIRTLQKMRRGHLATLGRGCCAAWHAICQEQLQAKALAAQRQRILRHAVELVCCSRPSTDQALLKAAFLEWWGLLPSLAMLRCMQQELELHRAGRAQLVRQYSELKEQLERRALR
ncbi:unnamed protein product [Effrenium voratum]|uniref:Uncharacterized protein n=1 Tax=Effrenium voratum TaxID=2562239 RepID=A0AA36NGD9_9DINO|nr:unnamed protein product [Effrenium voratum]